MQECIKFHARHGNFLLLNGQRQTNTQHMKGWIRPNEPRQTEWKKTHTHTQRKTKPSITIDITDTVILSSLVIRKTDLCRSKTVKLTAQPHNKPCGGMFPWQQPPRNASAYDQKGLVKGCCNQNSTKKKKKREKNIRGGKKNATRVRDEAPSAKTNTRRLMAVRFHCLPFRKGTEVLHWPRNSQR